MADFLSGGQVDSIPETSGYSGRSLVAYGQGTPLPTATVDAPPALDPVGEFSDTTVDVPFVKPAVVPTDFLGEEADELTPSADWFERFHVIAKRYDFGNLLATQESALEVYSAFRRDSHDWDTFVNNAGAGTTLLLQPSLPATIAPQGGQVMTLQVLTSGKPFVDDTLDFGFDTGKTIMVPIVVRRIVLIPVPPEAGYDEDLEFLVDVLEHRDGSEQRYGPRKRPRSRFSWNFILEDGPERSFFHNALFDRQHLQFGVPLWHFATRVSSAAVAGDTTINVGATAYRDFRVGGSVLLYTSRTLLDVQTINTINPTSLVLEDPIVNGYPAGTLVAPVVIGFAQGRVTGSRFPTADARMRMQLLTNDNDTDIADASAFSTFNSKVLLDGSNLIVGGFQEEFNRAVVVIDNLTGLVHQESPWDRGKRTTPKGFFAKGEQAAWEVRQLLHELNGPQTSFYLPTFSEDLTPILELASGNSTLDVTNVGYTQHVGSRQPRNVVRIVFNDTGITPLLRTVVSSVVVDDTRETLTLDGTWPATYQASEVLRVEYVEKARFATNKIRIRHEKGDRVTKFVAPVTGVFE